MKSPFDAVVEENTAWLYRFVRNRVGCRETAEDIVQEVWLRAFRVYDSYVEDGRIRHWLSRIARNLICNAVKRCINKIVLPDGKLLHVPLGNEGKFFQILGRSKKLLLLLL